MFFHFLKFIIGFSVYFDRRLYMRLYFPLLSKAGIKFRGTPRFIAKSVKFDDFELITLGNRLVISSNVILLTHDYSYTTGLIAINEVPVTDIGILGPITIGNNVFIGMNCIVLPGTTIGDNVIVGAGSVIRGKVESNIVISGNPAVKVAEITDHILKLKKKSYKQRVDNK